MQNLKLLTFTLIATVLCFNLSCKKEAGSGGKGTIKGRVTYIGAITGNEFVAAGATVYLTYGTCNLSNVYDEKITADSDGEFTFNFLNKGLYLVDAEISVNGFDYYGEVCTEIEFRKGVTIVNLQLF